MKLSESDVIRINNAISISLAQTGEQCDSDFMKTISKAVTETCSGTGLTLREKQEIVESFYRRIRGYDILQPLFDDISVTEIMVNGPDKIFFERDGVLHNYERSFESRKRLNDLIMRIFSMANRNICESEPIGDVRLGDGSRANAVLFPIAPDGPILTIRKFAGIRPDINSLINCGFLRSIEADYLIEAVISKKNIFISGGTGTGKTTFLNVLSGFIPSNERIITIEDSSELKLQNTPNLVRMEGRAQAPDGTGEITISHMIRCALRMRPDRIIVGEVRGSEASDMLWAMNTGHHGSLCTGHANSPTDMLSRLCVMVQKDSLLPVHIICSQIASAVDLVVHLRRLPGGGRCVDSIVRIIGFSEGEYEIETIYKKTD